MSEFEYLAVFMSIIFGISTTHVMAGVIRSIYRGDPFDPPAHLPFVSHYVVVALLALFVDKPLFHRIMAWYLLLTTITWSFVERLFL